MRGESLQATPLQGAVLPTGFAFFVLFRAGQLHPLTDPFASESQDAAASSGQPLLCESPSLCSLPEGPGPRPPGTPGLLPAGPACQEGISTGIRNLPMIDRGPRALPLAHDHRHLTPSLSCPPVLLLDSFMF